MGKSSLAALQELMYRMLRTLLLCLACVVVRCTDVEEKIKRNLDTWNADVACWGKENALKYHLGLYQAVKECTGLGSKKGFVKPANPWQSLPAGLNRGNVVNFLTNYLGNSRNKRQATGGLIETDEEEDHVHSIHHSLGVQVHIHHILHTEGKGRQQPLAQLQPHAFQYKNILDHVHSIHHIQGVPVHIHHILHTEGRGQHQPWAWPRAQQKQQRPKG